MRKLMLLGLVSAAFVGATPALAQTRAESTARPISDLVASTGGVDIRFKGLSMQQASAVLQCKLANTVIVSDPQAGEEEVSNLTAAEACIYRKTGLRPHLARDLHLLVQKYVGRDYSSQ